MNILKNLLFSLVLLAPIFIINAQEKTLEDFGLTEEAVKYLSQEEIDEILSGMTPEETQNHITNQDVSDIPSVPALFYEINDDVSVGGVGDEVISCFDHYSFGSIQSNFSLSTNSIISGTEAQFFGTITNNNNYPIVGGELYIKIFKKKGGEKDPNGPDVIEQFTAIDNITIPANGNIEGEFSWSVPVNVVSGNYQLATYFIVNDKFNLSGLSFTDDVVGNTFDFNIKGDEYGIKFDKSSVKINDNKYYFAAFPPRVPEGEVANISVDISNDTDAEKIVDVKWSLYSWDGINPENLISTNNEVYQVGPSSSNSISIAVDNNDSPVYYLVGELKDRDSKSIIGIRFVRGGRDLTRLNFPSITNYPIVEGQETSMFSCLHNTGESALVGDGRLTMELLNEEGGLIEEYEYKGSVSGEMMAVRHDFVPKDTLTNFSLVTKLWSGKDLVDESVSDYYCQDIDPDLCPLEDDFMFNIEDKHILYSILILVVIIILIAIKMFLSKPKDVIGLSIALLLSTSFFVPSASIEAKSTSWNTVIEDMFSYYWNWSTGDNISGGGWTRGLENPNITIKYHAEIVNLDTGELVSDGSIVPVGTNLSLNFLPHTYDDVYWFGTGYSADSPYGEWREGAAPGSVSCQEKDFVTKYIYQGEQEKNGSVEEYEDEYDIYAPLVVDSPEKTLTNIDNMSCGEMLGNETDGYSALCTVDTPGSINPVFNFSQTDGRFYYRYYDYRDGGNNGCRGNNIPMFVGGNNEDYYVEYVVPFLGTYRIRQNRTVGASMFTLNVPQHSIPFNLTAGDINGNPPNPPVIAGQTEVSVSEGYTSETYNFNISATDIDGDDVQYGVDWDNDGTADQWVPSSGYVASGTSQSVSKELPLGSYQFSAIAKDNNGLLSTWTTHSINITEREGPTCSQNKGDSCSVCGGEVTGEILCNGACSVQGETCNTTTTTSFCPLLPSNVGSATLNLFNKGGEFVLSDTDTTDGKTPLDIFNQYFSSDLQSEIVTYNDGNGDLGDISLIALPDGNPAIQPTSEPIYDFPIQAQVDQTCTTTLCPLSPNANEYTDNPACLLNNEGENILSNGCYSPGGGTSVKLLTSPNFMDPGDYCSISWCAQGGGAQSCVVTTGGTTIGTGISGTTNLLMGESSQQVQISCSDGSGGDSTSKIEECRLRVNSDQF